MRPHRVDAPGATAKNCARKPATILPSPQVVKKSNEPPKSESRPCTYEQNDDHIQKKKYRDDESKYHMKRDRDVDKDDGKGDQHDEKHSRKKTDNNDKKKGNTKVDEKKKERNDEKTRKKNSPEKDDGDGMMQSNLKEKKQRDDAKVDEKKKERDDEKTGKKKNDRDDVRQINTKEKKHRDGDRKTERDDSKPPTLNQAPQAGGTATTAHATPSAKKGTSSLVEDLSKNVQRRKKELALLEDAKEGKEQDIAETFPGQIQTHEEEIVESTTKIQALKLLWKDCQKEVHGMAAEIKLKRTELLEVQGNHAKAVVDHQKLEEQKELLVTTHLQKKESEEKSSASASDSSDVTTHLQKKESEEKSSASASDSSDSYETYYSDDD